MATRKAGNEIGGKRITSIQELSSVKENSSRHALIVFDVELKILAINDAAPAIVKNIFGKIIKAGSRFDFHISTKTGAQFNEEINLAFKGKAVSKEKDIQTATGSLHKYIVDCTPLFNNKKVYAISLSLLDIAESKNAEEALQRSSELLNSVFNTADIGLALIDEKGIYVKSNSGYNKLFGYTDGELVGLHYTVCVPSGQRKHSLEKFKSCYLGKRSEEERPGLKKDGEIIFVYRTISKVKNSVGSKFIMVTARDITETRKYQQLLVNTAKMAKIGGWEMDVVSGNLTHTEELSVIMGVNENCLRRTSPEKRIAKFFDAKTATKYRNAMERAIKNGQSFDLELPIKNGKQKQKWLHITCMPEFAGSKVIKTHGIIQDITFKKEVELQLERLSLVASKTNNAVFITDRLGKTEWINEAVTNMTGYNLSELIGKAPGTVLQGKDTDKATILRISKMLKKHLPVSGIIRNYRKDGTPFWVNMDIAPVFKENELINFIGIGVDITEIVQAREESSRRKVLEEQQKLLESLASNFPDGIIGVLNDHFEYVFVGGTEINKLGFTREYFIGNKLFDHISESSNKVALPYLQKAIAGEHTSFEVEMKGNYYSINAVPLIDQDKIVSRILIVLYNITINKNAVAELRETLRKEKELGSLKSRFVTMASHEFRTPLSTVLSSAYLIDKYKTTDDQPLREKHLKRIVSSVEMLTEILNDFLSLGKIEEGKVQVKLTQFNLPETIGALKREMKNNIKKEQKILYTHTGKAEVVMDGSLLKHIVMNLISNASKFSPDKSTIEVKTNCGNGLIILSVKDHGIGIAADDQRHLAERFFRAANATNIQGTGLGLHIISKYIELIDGTMRCKSELEKGTEFIITFKKQNIIK